MEFVHIPVLLNEVIKFLDPKSGENFIDCTLGGGGHSLEILNKIAPEGKLLGIDQDDKALSAANTRLSDFSESIKLVKGNFSDLSKIVAKDFDVDHIDGVLLDLGVSFHQLKNEEYGLSFESDEELDMRLGDFETSAYDIVNFSTQGELATTFRRFGGEKWAYEIAREIVKNRRKNKIKTTKELAEIITGVYVKKSQGKTWRIHPATRVFQALRIVVNHELDNLKEVLPQIVDILSLGGRVAVISFHSLEDRIVKRFFRQNKNLKIINKKPIVPSEVEVENNPASRSAKLRIATKI